MMDDFDYDDNVQRFGLLVQVLHGIKSFEPCQAMGMLVKERDRFWWRLDHEKGVSAL